MSDQRIQNHPQLSGSPTPDTLPDPGQNQPDIRLPSTDVMVVVFAWEKLRIIYNLVLLSVGIYYFKLGILLLAPGL